MMIPLQGFIDKDGLLDKLFLPDGGDTGHREGMFWTLRALLSSGKTSLDLRRSLSYKEVMSKIHPSPGIILRHSNPNYDASDWDRMSRDQFQPNIIAAGYWDKDELRKLERGHRSRGYIFTTNTRKNGATKRNHGTFDQGETRDYSWKLPDITGPEIWANFIRAYKAWWFYPLLLIFDLELLFGSIKWRYFPSHNIAMNHTLSMMQSWDRMRTPWSWLAVKVCPISYMITLIKDHFNDFPYDMDFFGVMFEDAWEEIR